MTSMQKPIIKVLLIEDDPMVQEVNRQFIGQIPGFDVVATASDGQQGVELVKELEPDLVLLDIYMPEQDGLEALHHLRKEGIDVDVIVITAANDRKTIRNMLQHGAVDYIIKPFKFDRLKQAFEHYREYVNSFYGEGSLGQQQIDQWLASHESGAIKQDVSLPIEEEELPKGLNRQTLKQIHLFLMHQTEPISAEEAADGIGIARVTARRYLDFLQKTGQVELDLQYGGVGRPVNRYYMKKEG